MAVLGVLARVDVPSREQILSELEQLEGVSTFSVEEEERTGLLIEASTMEAARSILSEQVDPTEGVLGTWPVFAHLESEAALPPE